MCKWYTIHIQNVLYSFLIKEKGSLFELCNIFLKMYFEMIGERGVAFAWN